MTRCPVPPTPLRWCPTCDKFVHDLPELHAEFHVGRDVFTSRTRAAQATWVRMVTNSEAA